jgi:hypothetical protein
MAHGRLIAGLVVRSQEFSLDVLDDSVFTRGMRVLSVLAVFWIIPATAQTTRLYDRMGNYQGQLSQEDGRLVARDARGDPHGYYVREGAQIVHRDNAGNRLGTATDH